MKDLSLLYILHVHTIFFDLSLNSGHFDKSVVVCFPKKSKTEGAQILAVVVPQNEAPEYLGTIVLG